MSFKNIQLVLAMSLAFNLTGCMDFKRQKTEQERAIEEAKPTLLPDKLQDFGNKNHKFSMRPPRAFLFSRVDTPVGELFTFATKPRQDGKTTTYTITCIDDKPELKVSRPFDVVNGLLVPYRENCHDFQTRDIDPVVINGHRYVGCDFTGSYGGYYPISGFIYITPVKGGFVVVQGTDSSSLYSITKQVMGDSLNTLNIKY